MTSWYWNRDSCSYCHLPAFYFIHKLFSNLKKKFKPDDVHSCFNGLLGVWQLCRVGFERHRLCGRWFGHSTWFVKSKKKWWIDLNYILYFYCIFFSFSTQAFSCWYLSFKTKRETAKEKVGHFLSSLNDT